MKIVEPRVELIAQSEIDYDALEAYLWSVGSADWLPKREPGFRFDDEEPRNDIQNLVEAAGRICYRSWEPGLNKNVTKVREDQGEYLENILRSGHGSVLEHANFTFVFKDVSRVFTHEMVRHRAGSAFSQESLRYVRLDELAMWLPEWAKQDESLMGILEPYVDVFQSMQRTLAQYFGLDDEGVDFHEKKEKTSFMRRFAPEGLATTMMWTGNLRTLRHVIEQRTAEGAEEEIRLVFGKVAEIMKREVPLLFSDFTVENGAWTPKYKKV